MTSTAATETASSPATSRALTERIRDQWAMVQSQWGLKNVWEQVGERIRSALDLPSREELHKLSLRLDQLDARIAGLGQRAAAVGTTAEKRLRKR